MMATVEVGLVAPLSAAAGAEASAPVLIDLDPERQKPTALEMALALLMIGATSFGRSPSPYVLQEFVRRRRWVTPEDFAEGYALAKLLPGPTASNLILYLVQMLTGPGVAALYLLPYAAPGAVVMLVASVFLFGHTWPLWLSAALAGASAAVLGLLLANVAQMMPAARKSRCWLLIALASFLGSAVLQANVIVVLLICGGASVWLNRGAQ